MVKTHFPIKFVREFHKHITMNTSNIIIAHPVSEDKLESLTAFLKALKIQFEIAKGETYNEDFIKMIHKGDEDIKNGKGITVNNLDDLWK